MTELCDGLGDGGLSSASGAPEPQYEGICIDLLLYPFDNFRQNRFSRMRMALWWIESFA